MKFNSSQTYKFVNENPPNAAIDSATAYAANEFVINEKPLEPWAKQSFEVIIDSLINHSEVIYPHATPRGIEKDDSGYLPSIINLLKNKKLISPYKKTVAEDMPITEESFKKIFPKFSFFATKNDVSLKDWINFHYSAPIMAEHIKLMERRSFTQKSMLNFWNNNNSTSLLANQLDVNSGRLMMAFDAFYRGYQYYQILRNANSFYFPHSLRMYVYDDGFEYSKKYNNRWSWGKLLADLIVNNKFPRNVNETVEIVDKIKYLVQRLRASWYFLNEGDENSMREYREKMESIASDLGLPIKVKDEVIKTLKILLGGLSAAVDTYLGTLGLVSVTLSIGIQKLSPKDVYIPGKFGKLKILRGLISWPAYKR